jgi:cytochrome c553
MRLPDAVWHQAPWALIIIQPKLAMKKILILATAIGFAAAMTASAADAKGNWEQSCAKCHGADGKGQTKMGQKLGIKDYTAAKVQAELKDDAAFKAIKEGLKDKEDKTLMKAAEALTDDEIKALVAYVRAFKP